MMKNKISSLTAYTLGDLFTIKHGYGFKGEYFTNSGSYILLTPGNFYDEGGFKQKFDKEKYYGGEIPDGFILDEGDLIVAMTEQMEGLLGSSAIIPASNKYLHNQRLGLITNLKQDLLDKKFLYYLFNTHGVRSQIQGSASGTKVRHTSPSRIYEVKIKLPPLPIQRKIADVLSAYDDLIEVNARRIRVLEAMAQSVYREWFGNVDAKSLPRGWEITTLDKVSKNFDAKRVPLSSMKRAEIQGEYPYYGAAKVLDHINDYIFDGKYLLVAEDGSVITTDGKPVLQMAYGKFWVNNHTHVLQGAGFISTEYLYLCLSEVSISGYITGAAQPKINQANLNRIPVILPPKDLLVKANKMFEDNFDMIETLNRQNANLRRTRDLLLPRLVSGEVLIG